MRLEPASSPRPASVSRMGCVQPSLTVWEYGGRSSPRPHLTRAADGECPSSAWAGVGAAKRGSSLGATILDCVGVQHEGGSSPRPHLTHAGSGGLRVAGGTLLCRGRCRAQLAGHRQGWLPLPMRGSTRPNSAPKSCPPGSALPPPPPKLSIGMSDRRRPPPQCAHRCVVMSSAAQKPRRKAAIDEWRSSTVCATRARTLLLIASSRSCVLRTGRSSADSARPGGMKLPTLR
jgi:hypothetical protein